MNPKIMPLGEYNGSNIWISFVYGEGYTGYSCKLSIGSLTSKESAKRAICDLVDAEIKYLASSEAASRDGKTYPVFNLSEECRQVFEKYKLPLPKE